MQLKPNLQQRNVDDLWEQHKKSDHITNTNSMATLTQPVHTSNTTFSPIKSSIDDTTDIINVGNRVTISKMKSQQSTVSNNISPKGNGNLSNANPTSPKTNGTTSPKPCTTSQNKPPKIKLLNRSANVASPLTEMNGLDNDDLADSSKEQEDFSASEDDFIAKTNGTSENEEKHNSDLTSTKNIQDSASNITPRHTTPQQQYSTEYASSPSSTTSSLNRENSLDYKDSTGVDLHEFMVKTLRENPRDRMMLLKLEKDFTEFIENKQKTSYKYNQMTSYHRMLVHRVAAYFGLDHNIDYTGKAVSISKTPSSRVPEVKFQSYCSREYTDEEISSPKSISILPRSASSDDQGAGTPSGSFDSEPANTSNTAVFSPSHSSEREAAIAAVAAKTGGKTGSANVTKRNKNFDLPLHQSYQGQTHWVSDSNVSTPTEVYGYSGGGGVGYAAGGQIEGNHLYYQPGYPSQVAYVPGNPSYIAQQQQQPTPQSQNHPYMPVYYVSGGAGATNQTSSLTTPTVNPSVTQQYYVHQTATGQIVYMPKHPAMQDGSGQMVGSQQQVHFQDLPGQMASVSLENHAQNAAARPDAQIDKQSGQPSTSPTSPTTPNVDYQTRKHVVYVPTEQIAQSHYANTVPGYPVHYYQNLPASAYQTYQDPNANSSQSGTPTNIQPPPSPTAAGLLQPHYQTNPVPGAAQSPLIAQPPHQYIQAAQAGQVAGHRARFSGPPSSMVYQRNTGNPVYVPVAGQPQHVTMLISAGQFLNSPKNYDVYRTINKGNNVNASITGVDGPDYRKLDTQQQQQQQVYAFQQHAQASTLPLTQQHRPLVQLPPNYHQQAYAYMSTPPRRFVNPVVQNQYIRSASPGQRKYRPHRSPAGNQQIRISRPYSQTVDNEQNTVGHILEIYDFPDNIVSDHDTIFEDVRTSGARILKINSSSSQSANATGAVVKPTILAIFKSSSEAQKALETVKSQYYKLRVSKKSPTHLSNSDYPNGSTNQQKSA